MRKNFGSKPWCYPQPGFIPTYDADGRILDETGKIDATKLHPITFDPVKKRLSFYGGESRQRLPRRHAAQVGFLPGKTKQMTNKS